MNPPPPIPENRHHVQRILAGALAANAAIAGLYLGLMALARSLPSASFQQNGWVAIPSLLLVPLVGGLVAAWVWRSLHLPLRRAVLHSLWLPLPGILGAAVFLKEGIICLVIGFPILWVMILAGILLGRLCFKPDQSRLNLCIVPMAALLTMGEIATRSGEPEVVVDEMLIHATPEQVWPHVLAFPEIAEPACYWMFRLGLPHPVATTNTGNHVGADRQCIFSDGIVIKEKVAEYFPAQRLTFDIVEQPAHPEAYGHITFHRGRFELRDNHDGTTTLVGSSWYTLHVSPVFYFNWWARDMTRAVHLRVMRHVKQLSENPA